MNKVVPILSLVVCLLLPCSVYAGRTKVTKSFYNEVVEIAEDRQESLMQIMNEMTRSQNGGSMMKTTYFGSPMVWSVSLSEGIHFSLNSQGADDKSWIKIGNSVLWYEGGKSVGGWFESYSISHLVGACFKGVVHGEKYVRIIENNLASIKEMNLYTERLSEYDSYIKKQVVSDRGVEVAIKYFWSKVKPLMDLGEIHKKMFLEKINTLYPDYIFDQIDYGGISDWKPLKEWTDMQSKRHYNEALATRDWYKKYFDKRKNAHIIREFKDYKPKKMTFYVRSVRFSIDAHLKGNDRLAGVDRFINTMQGLVDSGKAVHTVEGDYDIFTDATSTNGMKSRMLINRNKMTGYWEPAMFSYMDNIQKAAANIQRKNFILFKKMCLFLGQVMKEAIAKGNSTGQDDAAAQGPIDAL